MNPVRTFSSLSAPLPQFPSISTSRKTNAYAYAATMAYSRVVPIFEDYSDDEQSYGADILSPSNDMIVDSEDLLNDAEAEKDDGDIAIINPEDEPVFRADDCAKIPMSQIAQR
jgi:hypothetical protein